MTTYNTYQEAKIANPEYAIFEYQGDFGTDKEILDLFDIQGREMKECNPADYCMTVDKFLADGHKFVDGDLYQNEDGRVFTVGSLGYEAKYCNLLSSYCFTSKILILRAAALENIPTETPEEKEVLDSIESAGEVEWKNGDECVYMSHKVIHQFIGADPKREGYGYIQATGYEVNFVELSKLSKPETPHHREERERLEAAYDLYAHVQSVRGNLSCKFDWFFSSEMEEIRLRFLAIVDKTNYRKDKTHGTN